MDKHIPSCYGVGGHSRGVLNKTLESSVEKSCSFCETPHELSYDKHLGETQALRIEYG